MSERGAHRGETLCLLYFGPRLARESVAFAVFVVSQPLGTRQLCREGTRILRSSPLHSAEQERLMIISAANLSPALAIVFGLLILVFPRILNYLVGIYLILSGLLGLGVLAIR